jgi:hypothetical protein
MPAGTCRFLFCDAIPELTPLQGINIRDIDHDHRVASQGDMPHGTSKGMDAREQFKFECIFEGYGALYPVLKPATFCTWGGTACHLQRSVESVLAANYAALKLPLKPVSFTSACGCCEGGCRFPDDKFHVCSECNHLRIHTFRITNLVPLVPCGGDASR